MKKIFILICFFGAKNSFAQETQMEKLLKVVDIKSYCNVYLIIGAESTGTDTLYFISLKDSLGLNAGFEKINMGKQYLFKIRDMDYINGYYPPVMPEGYKIKFGNDYIKREGRNGKTITTTQYLAKNTNGLFIKQE